MWTLSVAGADPGRKFWTARAVNLGHVENCLLLVSFNMVCFGGLNAIWWRCLISADFYVMAYTLHSKCLVFLVSILGVVVLQSCDGNMHNLVCSYLPPFHTRLLL